MELVEHLEELRFRIIRSLIYVVVLAAVCWLFYGQLYALLKHPLDAAAGENVSLIYLHVTEAFFLQLQVCCIAGVVFASPLLVWEAWGFVAPALTSDERRPVRFMFPMAVFLFLLGVALSYAILPMGLKWFISYIPAGVELKQKTSDYILFVVKMCGAFGIGFELPVFLMMFAKVGIINSDMMKRYWRESTVVIMIVAAILTPSNDPLSMLMMSIPMVFLFFISIRLVKMVE
ncbi:MAG TPA: twin-arginine translocase subunit TatC [Armatimonadota bacterium]|jgi:sec-independent protein translocase protein TatC